MTSHSTSRDVTGEHLHLVHELDAPPAEVFRHLVEPALLARWFGPHSVRVPEESVVCEPFPGGEWNLVMVDIATSTPYPVMARVSEIVPPRLLVCREIDIEADDATFNGLRLRIELHEHDGDHTLLELRQGPFPADTTMAADSAEGWVQSFEKLDAVCGAPATPAPQEAAGPRSGGPGPRPPGQYRVNVNTPLPTGTQHVLVHGTQRAVIAEVGASIRTYSVDGRDVVLPFDETTLAPAFSGAVLAPWPNRLRDGLYRYEDTTYEVPLTEHDRQTALHGLVAYARFTPPADIAPTSTSVTLEHELVPTPGYPWALLVCATYTLDDAGLRVHVATTNLSSANAPYGIGFHPWLSPGAASVDECTLRVDAVRHVTVDERLLPTGTEPVAGPFDLREATALRGIALDDAWVDVTRDEDGLSWIVLASPDGHAAALWSDATMDTWQVCTGDGIPRIERRGVAAEPMSCVADAFRTGERLVHLAPSATHEVTWGLALL